MYDQYLADELREKIDLSDFELDTCEEIDDTCVITGMTDDGVRECRTYSINKQENFRDCWDYVREQHYTETIGYVLDFELMHTERLTPEVDGIVIQPNDDLRVFNGCLSVNGKPFVVEYPDEPLSGIDEDGRLVTLFRGHLPNHWSREDIRGYLA